MKLISTIDSIILVVCPVLSDILNGVFRMLELKNVTSGEDPIFFSPHPAQLKKSAPGPDPTLIQSKKKKSGGPSFLEKPCLALIFVHENVSSDLGFVDSGLNILPKMKILSYIR